MYILVNEFKLAHRKEIRGLNLPYYFGQSISWLICTMSRHVFQALYAIKNLLHLRSTKALVLKDFCALDGALERMRKQLQQLMVDDDHREYAIDVESLRREVELIFLEKLNKVTRKSANLIIFHLLKLDLGKRSNCCRLHRFQPDS